MSDVRPLVLVILDGWGEAPADPGNAVTAAKLPHLTAWRSEYPWTTLAASGTAVGLNPDQDGNSEAGHMNIGAGRKVLQEDVRISSSLSDGTFFRNPAFAAAIRHVRKHNSSLHLMGMLGSNESAHADPDHLLGLLMLAQQARLQKVWLHLFTDGRDSPRFYAREALERFLPHFGDARVATIMGRLYAMDRNKNWTRTEQAYEAIVSAHGQYHVKHTLEAISQAYNRGESDEFVSPTVVNGYTGMEDSDAVIFFNLRSDRARQLAKTFVQPDFERRNASTKPFTRKRPVHPMFVAMTDFGPDLGDSITAYPSIELQNTLPIALKDLRQLYVAESEKYAHVTYFFNGGYADPVAGEERQMVPSAIEKDFSKIPGMNTAGVTKLVCQALANKTHDVIVANFANPDMVGHTGNFEAGKQAMVVADRCVGEIAAAVTKANGTLLITGDHGNIEEMINVKTHEIDTEHSTNPVMFLVMDGTIKTIKLRSGGSLADVAPTILSILGREIPSEMTGRSLFA